MGAVQDRIAEILKVLGVTPYEVAARAGINRQTIYNIINNPDRNVSFETLRSICEAYPDISAEYLLRGTLPVMRSQSEPGQSDCEELKELVKEFNQKSVGML